MENGPQLTEKATLAGPEMVPLPVIFELTLDMQAKRDVVTKAFLRTKDGRGAMGLFRRIETTGEDFLPREAGDALQMFREWDQLWDEKRCPKQDPATRRRSNDKGEFVSQNGPFGILKDKAVLIQDFREAVPKTISALREIVKKAGASDAPDVLKEFATEAEEYLAILEPLTRVQVLKGTNGGTVPIHSYPLRQWEGLTGEERARLKSDGDKVTYAFDIVAEFTKKAEAPSKYAHIDRITGKVAFHAVQEFIDHPEGEVPGEVLAIQAARQVARRLEAFEQETGVRDPAILEARVVAIDKACAVLDKGAVQGELAEELRKDLDALKAERAELEQEAAKLTLELIQKGQLGQTLMGRINTALERGVLNHELVRQALEGCSTAMEKLCVLIGQQQVLEVGLADLKNKDPKLWEQFLKKAQPGSAEAKFYNELVGLKEGLAEFLQVQGVSLNLNSRIQFIGQVAREQEIKMTSTQLADSVRKFRISLDEQSYQDFLKQFSQALEGKKDWKEILRLLLLVLGVAFVGSQAVGGIAPESMGGGSEERQGTH